MILVLIISLAPLQRAEAVYPEPVFLKSSPIPIQSDTSHLDRHQMAKIGMINIALFN